MIAYKKEGYAICIGSLPVKTTLLNVFVWLCVNISVCSILLNEFAACAYIFAHQH